MLPYFQVNGFCNFCAPVFITARNILNAYMSNSSDVFHAFRLLRESIALVVHYGKYCLFYIYNNLVASVCILLFNFTF